MGKDLIYLTHTSQGNATELIPMATSESREKWQPRPGNKNPSEVKEVSEDFETVAITAALSVGIMAVIYIGILIFL